jgi:hypothetical protein
MAAESASPNLRKGTPIRSSKLSLARLRAATCCSRGSVILLRELQVPGPQFRDARPRRSSTEFGRDGSKQAERAPRAGVARAIVS